MPDIQGYMLLFFVWLISFSWIRALFKRAHSSLRLPPGPSLALPFIGHLHLLSSPLHQAFFKLSTRYGPLVHFMLCTKHCIVASSPEMAKEILRTNEESCCSRPTNIVTEHLTYGAADYIFTPYGPYWRFMKKICMNELLSGRTLEKFVSIRQEEIEVFLGSILQGSYTNKPMEVREELLKLTNNIISRMTMGKKLTETNDEVGEIRKVVQEVSLLLGSFNLGDFFGFLKHLDLQGIGKKVKEVHEKLDTIIEEVMKEHEVARQKMGDSQNDRRKDLLDLLIDLMEAENSEIKLSRESAKAFALEMFVAGTNGSASVIEWTLAELIKHPHIFLKARKEIDSVIGKDRLVRESDIPNLPYLQALVKETMRLHPPGTLVPRVTSRICKIGGYDVPANAILIVNVWAIGRDPSYWENPLEYCPERFLAKEENGEKLDVRGQHYQLLPFGSGRRGCPGASLALLVIQTTLASMIQCFDWNVNCGNNDEIEMAEKDGITLFLAKPLVCRPVAHFIPFSTTFPIKGQ